MQLLVSVCSEFASNGMLDTSPTMNGSPCSDVLEFEDDR